MASEHVLALLIAERDRITKAIEALQGSAKRRGRPPKNAAAPRKPRTAAQKKAQSEKMKKYWADRKKQEKGK